MKRPRPFFLLSLAGTAGFAALTSMSCSSSYEVDPEFCKKNPNHAECSPGAGGSGGSAGSGAQGSGGSAGGNAGKGGSGGSGGSAGSSGAGGSAGVMGQGGGGGPSYAINRCKILPEKACSRVEDNPPPFFGRVFIEGLTNTNNAPVAGVKAEFGVGPLKSDPTVDISSWAYTTALTNPDFNFEDPDDEYTVSAAQKPAGTYAYVYRFSLDNGPTVYCDTDDTEGFDPKSLGEWLVDDGLVNDCP